MPDLFENAARPYIRMSEGDGCSLYIAHKIIGTPYYEEDSLALEMGSALEPVIASWLAKHGFDVYFSGDEQLELASQDPYKIGHADGLITISDPEALDTWAKFNVPKEVRDALAAGELMGLEIKTMNKKSWRVFAKHGLDSSVALFRKYIGQSNNYLGTISSPENDEIWDSANYRALLKQIGTDRPQRMLFVGFNTDNKQIAFQIVDFDNNAYSDMNERQQTKIVETLRRGELPAPDYDGTADDCFFCPFANICPSVQALIPEDELDLLAQIDLTAPTVPDQLSNVRIADIASRYYELGEQIKSLQDDRTELRDQLEQFLTAGDKLVTNRHKISYTEVKGRRAIDMEALQELAKVFGFMVPYSLGKPYRRLTIKALYGPSGDDAGD